DIIDPAQKTYVELPFPPKGVMAQAVGGPAMHATEFTKTGKTRTIAGIKCDEYQGSGKFPLGEFTIVMCVSKNAPGAAGYDGFQKQLYAKLKDTKTPMPANMPDGVPLVQDVTSKMTGINLPNLPPETVAKLKEQFAKRPPTVSKNEVSKVEAKQIAASE